MQNRRLPRREAGFAMLLVFLLAACIAISLYMELPRVVFEAQRGREEMLIARGEQYKRAIQLYYRATHGQYPPTLDALENTNNKRFLRKRYKDPMTGADEWRIIHAGPGGVLTDSLVTKPPGSDKQADTSTTASTAEPPPPLWLQRRPSDGTMPSGATPGSLEQPLPGSQEAAAAAADQEAAAYARPGMAQPSPGQEPALVQPMVSPGQAPGMILQPGFPGAPQASGQQPSGQPYVQPPVVIVPGQPPVPTAAPGMTQSPSPAPNTGGVFGPSGQTGSAGPQAAPGANPAGDMIYRLLTTPNPQGLSALQQAPTSGGQPMGGTIAGVASKLEAEGIKVYGDRTKYNEWEFVYDPRQDRSAVGLTRGVQGSTPGLGNRGTGTTTGPPTGSRQILDDRVRPPN